MNKHKIICIFLFSQVAANMISELIGELKIKILTCPFIESCNLPKLQWLCNFPDYKLCRDYNLKLQKLKTSTKTLH
jgi:hypothetical protein